MLSISLERVTKRWGADAAVDDVSFDVAECSLTALLGPSGCGKSTTLRMIAGLDRPTAGVIRIGDADVTPLSPGQRRIAMVFQSYALFPHLTVAENIVFGLRVRKLSATERKRRLTRAAGMLGLEPLLGRKPAQLSGGQQQRVALGRAIVAETPVCLMDEPLSNLDAKLRVDMRREIRELQQTLGMTMVYVTHDQIEAMTMADQVVLMNRGRIEQTASPADLYERPATIFAARFIGAPPMNILPLAEVPALAALATTTVPPGRDPATLALGIRAEDIRLAGPGRGLEGRVTALEYLGAESVVEVALTGGPSLRVLARLRGRSSLLPGEPVAVAIGEAAHHWFELSSGRRIP